MNLPQTQYAVQLVGPDELILNTSKEVHKPGPHQILCRVESVGLCFSDLKLLKQFSAHARKNEIVSGIDTKILKEIPSYVPCDAPTVPGHEAAVTIAAVGPGVENFKPGQRYLVQTDYRWLRTESSNAAFGYNFEGALQQYVLMDERIITSPEGDSMLIPVSADLSASAVALVEPWACVEDAYLSRERIRIKPDGRMLVVSDREVPKESLDKLFKSYDKPKQITWISAEPHVKRGAEGVSELADAGYDDVIYFGSKAETVEALFSKLAAGGLLNIVLCGETFRRDVVTMIGRVHYGGIRITGTTGCDPAESMKYIPETGEVRPGNSINVIGAGGPMGTMHVIRNICQGIKNVSVFASELDEERLAELGKVAVPLAKKNCIRYYPYNPAKQRIDESFDYTVLMAPVPALVTASVQSTADRGIINIFAGIAATVTVKLDLNAYIKKRLYFIGTSGSTLTDMKQVLAKVESGRLDTNVAVAAVCGIEAAAEGIRAVENRSIAGKIMVYPACRSLGLVPLNRLHEKLPKVADHLTGGLWNKKAEEALLKSFPLVNGKW